MGRLGGFGTWSVSKAEDHKRVPAGQKMIGRLGKVVRGGQFAPVASGPAFNMAQGTDQDALLLNHHPESQIRVAIDPDDYLDLMAEAQGRRFVGSQFENPETVQKLKQRMQEGKPIDALFLDYDVKTGKITNQEGRHRSVAARDLGIKSVPLIIYLRDGAKYVRSEDYPNIVRRLTKRSTA